MDRSWPGTGVWLRPGSRAQTEGDEQQLQGHLIKLQIKSKESYERQSGMVSVVLERQYLDHAMQIRLPVVRVAVDTSEKKAWCVWLQHWVLNNEARLREHCAATVTIRIPNRETLASNLKTSLPKIARGDDPAAIVRSFWRSYRSAADWLLRTRERLKAQGAAQM